MKFLDLFSGIGGFRLGMEQAGHECVGHIEIDKYANLSYAAMHKPKESEFFGTDIRTVDPWDLPDADIYCGGFPCQSFSIAGKRGGFEDTRGTLFFEIARLVKERKPKIVLLENVKGLLSHDNGNTFETIIGTLGELGYFVEWQVLNSKNFGVPQNRERVFIVGHFGTGSRQEVFPIGDTGTTIVKNGEITNCSVREFGFKKTCPALCARDYKDPKWVKQKVENIGLKVAIPVLTPDRAEKRQNGRRFKEDGEDMFTLTAQDRHGVFLAPNNFSHKAGDGTITRKRTETMIHPALQAQPGGTQQTYLKQPDFRVRRLTPLECFRLQGFPDAYFHRAESVNSNSQLYKQAGNSVTVNVIYEMAKRLQNKYIREVL